MSKLTEKIREEFLVLLPPTVYFFVALHILVLVRGLMLKGTGVALGTTMSVAVGALILGKAVLIADLLPFIDRFPQKPIVHNIVWKTIVYTVVATLLHYTERLIDAWRDVGDFSAANEQLLSQMIWSHFWATEIMLTVLVLIFCAAREFVRAIGPERVHRMLFGPVPDQGA